jgi:transposase InsO family protein
VALTDDHVVAHRCRERGPSTPSGQDIAPDGPNQLWAADITYVAIASGFVYVAVIIDAWSRKVVGYAIGRSIDVRLTLAALRSATKRRRPPPGCVHHTDRGSKAACTQRSAISARSSSRINTPGS